MNRLQFVGSLIGGMFIWALSTGVALATEPGEGEVASPASGWIIATVDGTREVGYNVSVAVDQETGETYISYYEGVDGDLWLARTGAPSGNCGPGNTWECQVLDSEGIVGKYSSIAVGGPGPVAKLFIAYHDVTNGSLKVVDGTVDRGSGALTYETSVLVDGFPPSGVYRGTRSAVDVSTSGILHIVFQEVYGSSKYIYHATPAAPGTGNCGPGDEWECTAIDGGPEDVGDFIDIALSPGGVPIVAFHNAGTTDTHPIVATQVGFGGSCDYSEEWDCLSVWHQGADTGEYLSLAIGSDGVPHLAYRDETLETVEWAKYVGSGGNCGPDLESWQCAWIDSIGPGGSPSGIALEIDNEGYPVIAYQDVDSGFADLKIARPWEAAPWGPTLNCGPQLTWYCETLDGGNLSHAEGYGGLSIAVNADGEAVVAYRELFDPIISPEEGRLKVAIEPVSIFLDGFESGDTLRWSNVLP